MVAATSTADRRASLVDRHEGQEAEDGKKDIKYPFAFKSLDWDEYHRYRPAYPESMWTMWFDYHKAHGGEFQTAHDLGSGPGTLARVLGRHFSHVFVSDAGAANLATAAATLSPPEHFSFHQGPAEKAQEWLEPASVDFSSVGMAFHYMDADVMVPAVASTMKPGGTFAAVTYGFRLLFPGRPRLEELWYSVASKETKRLITEGKLFPAAIRGMAKAMAGLDFVPLPQDLFEDVRRVYINVDGPEEAQPFGFVDPDPDVWQPAPSRVGPGDARQYVRDEGWRRQADAAWLRGLLASSQMGFDDVTWNTDEWRELEAVVGAAPGAVVTVEWPVAMLLATRRRS